MTCTIKKKPSLLISTLDPPLLCSRLRPSPLPTLLNMNGLRSLLVLAFALLAIANAFVIDSGDELEPVEDKRSPFQHIWRNIEMQMPATQREIKRSESLSRARANAYYRLG